MLPTYATFGIKTCQKLTIFVFSKLQFMHALCFFGKGNEGESQNPHQTLIIIKIAKPMPFPAMLSLVVTMIVIV